MADKNEYPRSDKERLDTDHDLAAAAIQEAREARGEAPPVFEDAYWRELYAGRPYARPTLSYEEYSPAYRYGWESRYRHPDQSYEEAEKGLEGGWQQARAESQLEWEEAGHAAKDAWTRAEDFLMGDSKNRNPRPMFAPGTPPRPRQPTP